MSWRPVFPGADSFVCNHKNQIKIISNIWVSETQGSWKALGDHGPPRTGEKNLDGAGEIGMDVYCNIHILIFMSNHLESGCMSSQDYKHMHLHIQLAIVNVRLVYIY